MAIRWDSKLKSETRAVVKSFNAKIKRLEAKGVSSALLPDRISSKEIRQGILNRRDLRKRLAQLSDFTSAGIPEKTEGGLIATPQMIIYREGEANRAIEQLRNEHEKIASIETRYPMMKSEWQNTLEAKMEYLSRDITKMDMRQINIFNKNLFTAEQKTMQDANFYKNFNKMLFYNAYKAGLPPDLMSRITGKISKLTPQQLLELYATDPAFAGVKDTYELGKIESAGKSDQEVEESYERLDARLDELIASTLVNQ